MVLTYNAPTNVFPSSLGIRPIKISSLGTEPIKISLPAPPIFPFLEENTDMCIIYLKVHYLLMIWKDNIYLQTEDRIFKLLLF